MQSLKEVSRSHESMASSSVEVVQKNPNPNLVGDIRASVAKLEGAMGSGQHGG